MPTNERQDIVERAVCSAIGFARIVWGATTTLASRRVHEAIDLTYPGPDRGIWIKAFGVRDIIVGMAALHPDHTVSRFSLRFGILMDVIDAAVVADAARQGLPRRAAVVGMTFAGGAALLGTLGLHSATVNHRLRVAFSRSKQR